MTRDADDAAPIELQLSPGARDWIDLEVEENDYAGVQHWVATQVRAALRRDLAEHHAPTVAVTVDVPEGFARRVSRWAADRGLEPGDGRIEEFAVDHLDWRYAWLREGEPWTLLEGEPSAEDA